MADVDAIVVGAGPAGSAAAIALARAGKTVVLIERGPFPGSKNMYGGVVYGRMLDELLPHWWQEAPIQRWVTRRQTMICTDHGAVTIDVRNDRWGAPPYNGATAYRPDFDHWLATKATDAGAQLLVSTTVTGLLRDGDRVIGVQTDRPDGELTAEVVIACDGVNSFCAKEAGLYTHNDPDHFTLGVKETIALPRDVIEQRFGVRGLDGVDIEALGCTQGVPGGGFVYTNLDTIGVGLVLHLPSLAKQSQRPEQLLARFKEHSGIAPLIEGGDLKEYSAHVIPEAGYQMMPTLSCDGMLVAGDAAALCLAAGIWLEGVNFAIGSGWYAGLAAVDALTAHDTSHDGLASYRQRLESTFVLKDHRKLRRVPALVMSERAQQRLPIMVNDIASQLFTVNNPAPKPGLRHIANTARARAGLRRRDLVKDSITALRSFG
jgi:electron transfer flavoprotein-quinone oxidoreductase